MLLNYKENHQDWRKFTTEILVEVYGDSLPILTERGSRGTLGINNKLLDCIYREYFLKFIKLRNCFTNLNFFFRTNQSK